MRQQIGVVFPKWFSLNVCALTLAIFCLKLSISFLCRVSEVFQLSWIEWAFITELTIRPRKSYCYKINAMQNVSRMPLRATTFRHFKTNRSTLAQVTGCCLTIQCHEPMTMLIPNDMLHVLVFIWTPRMNQQINFCRDTTFNWDAVTRLELRYHCEVVPAKVPYVTHPIPFERLSHIQSHVLRYRRFIYNPLVRIQSMWLTKTTGDITETLKAFIA